VVCLLCVGLTRVARKRLTMRITTVPIAGAPPPFRPHQIYAVFPCPACDGSGWAKIAFNRPRRPAPRRSPWHGLTLRHSSGD
jgi:hypothetical protein